MNSEELKGRTKEFALQIIKLMEVLPGNKSSDIIGRQVLRSATSIGANYRAACRAKSKTDFIYKIAIVEEEADETVYWLELLYESNLLRNELIRKLAKEANELTAIFSTTRRSARSSITRSKVTRSKTK